MKVLIINKHISDIIGGSEIQCDLIAKGLAGKGHDVVYVVAEPKEKSYSDLSYKTIPLRIEKKRELSNFLRREKPDIIYWRYNKNHFLRCAREARKEKIPFVFAISHVHDVMKKNTIYYPSFCKKGFLGIKDLLFSFVKSMDSQLNFLGFKYIDAITSLNRQYIDQVPAKNKKVIWNSVPNGKEGFEWGRPFCFWVANIKARKNPEAYLKLSDIMRERYPGVDFLMAGEIQDKRYENIIKKAQENENFHYLGQISPEKVNGVLQKAICLVHTCRPEGFGNNFIQAWMQGCPTISLEYDPDNLIQEKNLGFLSGSLEQMALDLQKIMENDDLRNKIGVIAKSFAQENFTSTRMVEEVETFLEEVIHASRH